MKRILFILLAAVFSSTICSAAMSNSKIRKETRFLTDKMAHEMNLNTDQYNDVYEINFDFISGISFLMDDVLRGEEWALNRYYDYLDVRNDDLRWILTSRQYGRFMQADYFFRPVYVNGGRWAFRIYVAYANHNHFYFPRPYHYRTYCGGHYRTHHNNASFYRGRYTNQPVYRGTYKIRDHHSYTTTRRSDFGSVSIRPNTSTRPAENVSTRRSSSNRDSGNTRRNARENSRSRKTKVENTKSNDKNNNSRGSRVSTGNTSRRNSSDGTQSSGDSSSRSFENRSRR